MKTIAKSIIWPGCRVLNTRPAAQAEPLNQWIKAAGGIPIPCPMLSIQPIPSEQWLPSLPSLEKIDHIIFTSVNAVNYFFKAHHKKATPHQYIAIGKTTAAALAQYGLTATVPPIFTSEHLLNLPCLQSVKQQSIVLVKGKGGRTLITETLQQRQANLICIDVYQRNKPHFAQKKLQHLWQENGVDMIILTSKEAMQNLIALSCKEALPWIRSKPCLVISQRLAACAKDIGMQQITILDSIGELQG